MIKMLLFIIILILISCSDNVTGNDKILNVEASFTYSPTTNIKTGDIVKFTNTSKNADLLEWNFGDGTSSTIDSPGHIYEISGIIEVQLIAKSSTSADTTTRSISIAESNPHYGKYYHENGYGGSLSFLADNVLLLSGPSGSVSGSYRMISPTKAEIDLADLSDGEFINNFMTFKNLHGTWNKE
ncbi:MAG: PKD domain-containing protein [Candidatus Delongbacteria bacterium]|nr:PKD domain-containing protein [Candidatus Delongbacteria bacterium]MBN2833945.1 PKD domain-containing protein [Candidatus Delongbacteria bacterium]